VLGINMMALRSWTPPLYILAAQDDLPQHHGTNMLHVADTLSPSRYMKAARVAATAASAAACHIAAQNPECYDVPASSTLTQHNISHVMLFLAAPAPFATSR
jgi:hypothetical protein